jgi:hypothetical protein
LETSDENKDEILNRCVAADPHHGDKWLEVAKMPVNTRKKTDKILWLGAARLVSSVLNAGENLVRYGHSTAGDAIGNVTSGTAIIEA